uniref:Uncharacterized protein LOC114347031 n=1 Tax=Diabrotica virgifera virgifera TaxID=50390 RepID=A0A6P7H765_DIAVI
TKVRKSKDLYLWNQHSGDDLNPYFLQFAKQTNDRDKIRDNMQSPPFNLSRSADMQNIRNYLYLEREKILDAMAATMRLKSFNFNHMSFIKSITCDLLSIEGCVSESYSAILKQILDNFEGLGGINETVEICYVVIEKYDVSTSAFEICAVWILTKGSQLLFT